VTPETLAQFQANMRDDIEHFNVLKVKLFDNKTQLIYSSDNRMVGQFDKDNRRLANALAGNNDSLAVKKDKISDFNGQERFAVDVVETYVPIRDNTGRVVGCFELYQDITRYYREIIPFVVVSGGIMLFILSTGFLVSHVLLRKTARQLKDAQEILESQACTDFLTGIYNRRQLLFRCEEEISRCKRMKESGTPMSSLACVMIDIDHFKHVNDTYGHAAGDEVIRELANRLKQATRPYDIVGRYGGEEFLVVICQSDDEFIRTVSERLWSIARSTPILYGDKSIDITISLGVAKFGVTDESHDAVIIRADHALYQAKNEGRDRICYDIPVKNESINLPCQT
jgi:diguanylate cyclase (GGDEF)-like protein